MSDKKTTIDLPFSTALITGASAGIGAEFARQVSSSKVRNIVLTARRKERLEEVKKEILENWALNPEDDRNVYVFPCDLSREKERNELIRRIEHERLEIDLLINNAGFGSMGKFSESEFDWESAMVTVNCIAPLHLSRHFIPSMQERFSKTQTRSGIINVSSIASFQSVPYMATYGATKAFLTSLTLAIQAEVHDKGIDLLALCPGPTESEFYKVVGLSKKVEVVPSMTSEEVVKQALESLRSRKRICVNGFRNTVLTQVNRFLPKMAAASIGEKILKPYLSRKL